MSRWSRAVWCLQSERARCQMWFGEKRMCQGGVKRNRLIVSVGRGRDPEGRFVAVDGLPRFASWIKYVFKDAVKCTDFKSVVFLREINGF